MKVTENNECWICSSVDLVLIKKSSIVRDNIKTKYRDNVGNKCYENNCSRS